MNLKCFVFPQFNQNLLYYYHRPVKVQDHNRYTIYPYNPRVRVGAHPIQRNSNFVLLHWDRVFPCSDLSVCHLYQLYLIKRKEKRKGDQSHWEQRSLCGTQTVKSWWPKSPSQTLINPKIAMINDSAPLLIFNCLMSPSSIIHIRYCLNVLHE